jgi:hypothetical protein
MDALNQEEAAFVRNPSRWSLQNFTGQSVSLNGNVLTIPFLATSSACLKKSRFCSPRFVS